MMDLKQQPDWNWLKGRTVIITGAANGLGRGMAREWAQHGAHIVVGDMDEIASRLVLEELNKISGSSSSSHCFVKTDVTSWDSQVNLFNKAVEFSPGGHVDVVVANAGIGESDGAMFIPSPSLELKKPNLKTIDIDLTGVIYTAHLAYHFFSLPPRLSSEMSSIYKQFSEEAPRQHSLLLVGSMASLKYSSEPLYAAAKHGVLGLFRTLRRPHYFTSVDRNNPNPNEEGRSGQKMKVKTGLLCPFFAPTAILGQSGASQVEAGSKSGPPDIFKDMELTKISEIVEAASRLILDKEGGKAMVIMTEAMAKVAGRGRAKGGMFEVGGLEGKL